ncbi:MAG: glycosyltransferase family 2 protein [Nitrospinota bacterium]
MKLSIIIANWNGASFLKECLQSLALQMEEGFEVLVVDNGSHDHSCEMIQTNFPFVLLIENNENLGFAKANNLGIKAAKGEYVITINNDTRLEQGFLTLLLSAAEKEEPHVGMWAPKILCMDAPHRIDSVGGLLLYPDGIGRGRGRNDIDQGQYDHIRDIFFPSACAAMYRRSMLLDVGGFDDSFFAYCEDTDLGLRSRLLGWEAKSVPMAIIYHHYSGTTGKYASKKAYLVERNRQWVVLKNFPCACLLASPLYTLWRFAVQGYGVFSGKGTAHKIVSGAGKGSILKNMLASYKDAILKFSKVFRDRLLIQKRRKISDRQLRALMKKNSVSAVELVLKE